jgi:hypothetical protein
LKAASPNMKERVKGLKQAEMIHYNKIAMANQLTCLKWKHFWKSSATEEEANTFSQTMKFSKKRSTSTKVEC